MADEPSTPRSEGPPSDAPPPEQGRGPSRRTVMKGAGITLGALAFAKAVSPVTEFTDDLTLDQFLQRHYKELTPEQKDEVLARVEEQTRQELGVDCDVRDPPPIPGVKFAYAINLSKCNGNGKCVEACHEENNHDRDTNQSYIRVLEMQKGSMDMEKANTTYDHPVPADDKYYLPVQCQQCDAPPCTSVCPVEATWKEADGIVVVDYDWCIGCRYCEAACPYHARRFNWEKPNVPAEDVNPNQGYLSNRIRPQGAMEKCHFCLHRTREGQLPACAEACPTGARVFGNIADDQSDIRWILQNKRVFVLKEELGTKPSFFYFFDD